MTTVLNWSRFEIGLVSPEDAFEAFCTQLFERWVARELGDDLNFYALRGAGGDGGVEAFATLTNGEVHGLQAKWFPRNLDSSRMNQIRNSVDTALRTFPTLRRYIVAMPHKLTNGTPGKDKKPRKGGVERWAEFIDDLAGSHPQLEIVRWDEGGLLDQLAHPGNQEIKALWFDGEFTHKTLETAWRKTKNRLRGRYLPSLHAVGQVDAIIDADSWTHEQVVDASEALEKALDALAMARSDLEGFERLTSGNLPAGLSSAIPPMADTIGSLRACAESLASVMTAGPTSAVEVFRSTAAIEQFEVELDDYERGRSGAYAARHAARALSLVRESLDAVRWVGRWVHDSAVPRIIQGPAGCGKTHAVARAVERLVERGAPALMILAKTHDPGQGARRIMSEALDAPEWSLSRMLDGLEALAIIDQLRLVKASSRHDGFSRCLVIIDGLEESPSNSQQWFNVIGDIAVELESRRRVHLLASARPEYVRQRTQMHGVTLVELDVDGDVDLPALFRSYANHYAIRVDRVPWLGWAMRNALEVRLFAEEFAGRLVSASEGANANLLTLFRRKFERLEAEARDRAGSQAWSDHLDLVFWVLTELTELGSKASSGWIPSVDIVRAVAALDPEFTAQRVRGVLSLLVEYGLIDQMLPPVEGLAAPQPVYILATRHVSDFVLASALARATLAEIAGGDELVFPKILLERESAAILYAARLAQCGHFVVDLSWSNAPLNLRVLHAASLRLLPPDRAGQRGAEIERWLIETTGLNRRLLTELVVQIARIPEHPLGPRLLDRALRSLPLAERDPIWSVPEDLSGTGPWSQCFFVPILDNVRLSAHIDNWESLPLLVAWTCSSVVEERRRRAREMLARWGGSRLADMVELLAYMADVDDPQLLDDLVVAALGAAVIAPVNDPALGDLARLVDRLFFAEQPSVPTTSVPIRLAARAIVERAALSFPDRFDVELARAKPPYKAHGSWPALDLNELREGSPALGKVVVGDLDRYVADRCFREFSNAAGRRRVDGEAQVDPSLVLALESGALDGPKSLVEAQRERRDREQAKRERGQPADVDLLESLKRSIAAVKATREDEHDEDENEEPVELTDEERFENLKQLHDSLRHEVDKPNLSNEFLALLDHAAEVSATTKPPARLVRNAMIARLVRNWGWSPEGFRHYKRGDRPTVVDDAIARRHGAGASHGQRSEVATFNEKYVWAAADRVAGALADRLPVWSEEAGEWRLLTTLEKIGNDFPDPMPRSVEEDDRELAWAGAWEPEGILTEQFADEPDLVLRAERWLTEGDLPDPRAIVRVHAEGWSDAQVLGLSHLRYGHQYCVNQLVEINAFAIDPADLAYIRRDARHVLQNLHDGRAWLDGGVYGSPAIACWAPWLTWHQEHGYNSFTDEGTVHRVRIHNLVGSFTARYEGQSPGEPNVWLPSPGLRTSLGVVGMQGGRWHRIYLDRGSRAVAVERDSPSVGYNFDHHYLVTSRKGLMNYLAPEGLRPAWFVRVFREVTPALFMNDSLEIDPKSNQVHRSRDTTWLLLDLADDDELELIAVGDEFERFE